MTTVRREAIHEIFLVICFLIHEKIGLRTTEKAAANTNIVRKGKRIIKVNTITIDNNINKKYFSVEDIGIGVL